MTGRSLLFVPAYLGFALLSVNLLSVDPSDVIFAGIAAALLLLSPTAILFPNISFLGRLGALTFLALYAVSCTFGYRPTFVLYLLSGVFLTLAVAFFSAHDNRFRIGSALFFGFLVINVLAILAWSVGLWPGSIFFELFRDGRFNGITGDPNFTGLMAAFAFYFTLDRLLRKQAATSILLLNGVGTVIALTFLLFSQSRSAWAAAAVGLAVYLVGSKQIFRVRTVVAMLGIVFSGMIVSLSSIDKVSSDVGSVADRINTVFVQDDPAEQERFKFVYTRASLNVGLDHPLGVGPGMTFSYTGLLNADGGPIGSHNAYVEIFTENGWVAAFTFVALLALAWVRLYRLSQIDVFLNDVSARTMLAGLTATAVFGMGHDLLGWRMGWVFPALAIVTAFNIDFDRYRAVWAAGDRH